MTCKKDYDEARMVQTTLYRLPPHPHQKLTSTSGQLVEVARTAKYDSEVTQKLRQSFVK
jgi:hypothetical protein